MTVDINSLNFTSRTHCCLRAVGINTTDDLRCMTEYLLSRIPGVGRKCLNEILCTCETMGIELMDAKQKRILGEYRYMVEKYERVLNNNLDFIRGKKKGLKLMNT